MTNEVAQLRRPVEVQSVNTLPAAVELIATSLQEAVVRMEADDVVIEMSSHQEGSRSSAHFSFRAYKRSKQVAGEERDV